MYRIGVDGGDWKGRDGMKRNGVASLGIGFT